MFKEIKTLLIKDFRLELKQKNNISTILLYSVTSIFMIYMLFSQDVDLPLWNALFWLVSLFAATSAISKSFINESGFHHLYIYTLVSPQAVITAKIIFNTFFMLLLTVMNIGLFVIIFNKVPPNFLLFCMAVLTGIIGFSVVLTMISAISSRTSNNFLLMSVLGFPVIIPMLLSVSKLSSIIIHQQEYSGLLFYFLILGFLIIASFLLSLILFPYIWRE